MRIDSGRFGTLDVDNQDVIYFPTGLIGFAGEHEFVLLRKTDTSPIGWLQSIHTKNLALPVVSIESLANEISVEEVGSAISRAQLDADIDECAVMAVLCVPGPNVEPTVNLLAPIIVNARTRTGSQVILEDTKFTTTESFCLLENEASASESIVPIRAEGPQSLTANP